MPARAPRVELNATLGAGTKSLRSPGIQPTTIDLTDFFKHGILDWYEGDGGRWPDAPDAVI